MDKDTFLALCGHFFPDMLPVYYDDLWEMLQKAEAEGHDPHEVIEMWRFAALRAAQQLLRDSTEQDEIIMKAIRSQPLASISVLQYMKSLSPEELEEYNQAMKQIMEMQDRGKLSGWLEEMRKGDKE
jgi:hypothetical protein